MKITWLSQGSFLFESEGTRILVDPYMSNCLEFKGLMRMVKYPLDFGELNPDILICTHDHLDHLDPETVKEISRLYPDCIIAGPKSCCEHFGRLGIEDNKRKLLEWGNEFKVGNFKLTPVFAIHTSPDAVGLILEAENKRIYLSGDTEYDERLVNRFTKGCDLILICINGRLGNMSLEEALQVVKAVEPKTALPMHYGLFARNTADPAPFIEACKNIGIESFEMRMGKEFKI